jgi:nitroreductase
MVVKVKNTPEHLYAIAEIVRAFTPLALTAAGLGIGIFVITSPNLSADKFAIAMGSAGAALTGACGAYNPQSKERRQAPQMTRVGHIDQVDIEQTVEENEGESRGDRF